jgi:hypothetical protein
MSMSKGTRRRLLGLFGTLMVLMSMAMQMSLFSFAQQDPSAAVDWTMQLPVNQELPAAPEKEGDDQPDTFIAALPQSEPGSAGTQLLHQPYPLNTDLPEDPLSLLFQPPV